MNFEDSLQWMVASQNCLRASPWRLFVAKLLGERVEGRDGSHICIGYRYKGVIYLTEFHTIQ